MGLSDSAFFVDYPSIATKDRDYSIKMKAVVDLVN
jgi:hypothetical protein